MTLQDWHPAALQSIQRLMIEARLLCGDEAPYADLFRLMDDTEYLVGLVYEGGSFESFQQHLKGTCEDIGRPGFYARFESALHAPLV